MANSARKQAAAQPPISLRFRKDEQAMLKVLRARATASRRSLSEQIKYYAHLGIVAKDNPDLPMEFIEGTLEGLAEARAGLSVPYTRGVTR